MQAEWPGAIDGALAAPAAAIGIDVASGRVHSKFQRILTAEREAARQVIPYESDLVEGLAARYGCVASGGGTDERPAPERSDEDMWHATVDSLADLKRACQDYGISAMKSKEQLAARIYHPDQPGQKEKRRRLKAPTASGGDP